jgi:PAS domain-containing protein
MTLMRALFARLPVAVAYLAGPDLVFEFANDEYRQLVGGRDVLGLPVRAALPELAGQGRFELLGEALESWQPLRGDEVELWIRRQGEQPEQVFVDFVYQPVSHGLAAGVLIFAADVTVRVRDRARHERLAAQLAITQERYRTLFDTLPQGVIYHAADGRIIEASPAAGEILGVDPAASGTAGKTWRPGTSPTAASRPRSGPTAMLTRCSSCGAQVLSGRTRRNTSIAPATGCRCWSARLSRAMTRCAG